MQCGYSSERGEQILKTFSSDIRAQLSAMLGSGEDSADVMSLTAALDKFEKDGAEVIPCPYFLSLDLIVCSSVKN